MRQLLPGPAALWRSGACTPTDTFCGVGRSTCVGACTSSAKSGVLNLQMSTPSCLLLAERAGFSLLGSALKAEPEPIAGLKALSSGRELMVTWASAAGWSGDVCGRASSRLIMRPLPPLAAGTAGSGWVGCAKPRTTPASGTPPLPLPQMQPD